MHAISRKPLALVVAAVIVVIGAAGAYAYWTSGGGGSGTAATGTSADLVVQQTSEVTGMGPGVDAQALNGNFDNGSGAASYVGSVSVVVTDTTAAGCTADDYTITGSPMVVGALVPAGLAQGAWTGATIAFNNTASNQDACQGATVHLAYSIAGTTP
jgi:hypothetical protein